jgi:hypothetical protein
MILNGNERGNARNLAAHLMNVRDNEHVELHDLRGFVADDLHGALEESEAIAMGTRCKKHLFSLSLNPPGDADVPPEHFEAAIDRIEKDLGLENQPRAIVFHEKEARRHAHVVWSRIDGEEMKAIPLPFYKRNLTSISRDLYLEHGWRMPDGLRGKGQRDPLNFTLAEWQQAKRTRQDPREMKVLFQACWSASDDRRSFEAALKDKGLWLARGDKRGFVAMDWRGEVYSLSRMTSAKTKNLKARLGDPRALPSTDETRAKIAERLTPKLKAWAKEAEARAEKEDLAAKFQRDQMVQRHRHARTKLRATQQERWLSEEKARAARLPKGIRGLWGWITGRNRSIRKENEVEIARAKSRDQAERSKVIKQQLDERRNLQRQITAAKERHQKTMQELNRDIARAMETGRVPDSPKPKRDRGRARQRGPARGPEPGQG